MIEQRISELTAAILTLVTVIQAQGSTPAASTAKAEANTPAPETAPIDTSKADAAKAKADKAAADKAAKDAAAKAKTEADAKAKAEADAKAEAEKAASATLPDLTSEIQKALQPILKQKKLVQAKEVLATVGKGAPSFAAIPRELQASVLEALQTLEIS